MANAPAIYKILQAQQKSEMIIVTEGISAGKADELYLNWTRSIEEALRRAFKICGKKLKWVLFPWVVYLYRTLENKKRIIRSNGSCKNKIL